MQAASSLDTLLGHIQGLELAMFSQDGRCRLARGRLLDAVGRAGSSAAELFDQPWQAPIAEAVARAPRRFELTTPAGRTLAVTSTLEDTGVVLLTLLDITSERETRRRLEAASERFRTAFEHASVALTLLGPDLAPVASNAAVGDLLGGSSTAGGIYDHCAPPVLVMLLDAVGAVARGERATATVEHYVQRPDGGNMAVRSDIWPIELDDSSRGCLLQTVELASGLDLADELRRLTGEDQLTGLLNREGLAAALETASQQTGPLALLLADVDDFARVNALLGEQEGDIVLREVAGALGAAVREGDILARIDGDEFAILLPGLDVAAAGRTAEAVMERFTARLNDRGGETALLRLTLSIGITDVTPGANLDHALAGAGIAVYAAKQAGKGRWMAGL